MIKVVSWNIGRRKEPWRTLQEMAHDGAVDVALLQETGSPPEDLSGNLEFDDQVFWNRQLYDRWPLVVKLSDHVEVQPYRQVPPISDLAEGSIGVSGIGTIAAAKVTPRDSDQRPFVAVSMYARWLRPHPSTASKWKVGCADSSAHRIISDLSAFIGDTNPASHRILAAGDLNMIYGAIGRRLSLPERERTVWTRMEALGLEFLGPQLPHGRPAVSLHADLQPDTKNVPTYYSTRESPATAKTQLDYAFASRGFHEGISVRAMNEPEEWGASDHCRLLIEVRA